MASSPNHVEQQPAHHGEAQTLPLFLNASASSGTGNATAANKSPMLRRVPPPRFSQAIDAGSLSHQSDENSQAGLGIAASFKHMPSASVSSLSSASQPMSSRSQSQGSGSAPNDLYNSQQTPASSSPTFNIVPPMHSTSTLSQQRQSSPARPAIMSRTSSGGAKIAALASKFGTSAVQKVAAAKQQVQLSASAAIASASSSSSSRNISPGGSTGIASGGQDFSTVRAIAGGFKDKGTSFVNGAAARMRSKGKERSLTAPEVSLTSSSPRMASAGNSPNPQQQKSSPELLHSASQASIVGLGRRPSVSSRVVLGQRIPSNTAGVVFGAPLKVAADRTKMRDAVVQDLPSRYLLDPAAVERRRDACRYLPAIAVRCLDYLNEHGKTEEGLYRVPGSSLQVANIRAIFDSGSDVDLLQTLSTRDLEPSAVASCFKLWLRELPESLLHTLEREINILLMEHTGNAASAKVAMAQAQSGPTPAAPAQNAGGSPIASPVVVERIRDLFSHALPKENLVLLREISYHLAHLDSFSSVNKMTFSNLRLILSPTLKLSPVMLSLLVNERESIFPKPGQLDSPNINRLSVNLPSTGDALGLSFQTDDFLPPLPSKSAKTPLDTAYKSSSDSQAAPSLRAPFSSIDSGWSALSSVSGKRSSGSLANYRASWHIVDLPPSGLPRNSETDDEESHSSTPIARKFQHARNVSASNLLEKRSSPPSSQKSSSSPLQRTPTFSGFSGRSSPSPFFSAGAPAGTSAFTKEHLRKRSSISSVQSLHSAGSSGNRISADWKPYNSNRSSGRAAELSATPEIKHHQDEEEELSSSDTSTTISSTSSTLTPSDSHNIRLSLPSEDGHADSRRTTITAESFASLGSRLGVDRSREMKKKRGSMMIMNLPDMSGWDGGEEGGLLSVEERRRLFQA